MRARREAKEKPRHSGAKLHRLNNPAPHRCASNVACLQWPWRAWEVCHRREEPLTDPDTIQVRTCAHGVKF